jgi:hypothetical protein
MTRALSVRCLSAQRWRFVLLLAVPSLSSAACAIPRRVASTEGYPQNHSLGSRQYPPAQYAGAPKIELIGKCGNIKTSDRAAMTANNWSHEETDDPVYADRGNKLEKTSS